MENYEIKNDKIIKCMEGLSQLNFEISYYLQSNYDLTKLYNDLEMNKYIKNLSFHYSLYDSLKKVKYEYRYSCYITHNV